MQTGTGPPAQRRRLPAAVSIPLLVLAGMALGILATRPLGGEPEPSFFVIGSAQPGVQIGQIAPGTAHAPASPALDLEDLDGSALALRDFDGKPLWIVFWKTDCEPCEAEAADVAAAYAAHRST